MKVSRCGYDGWRDRSLSDRDQANMELLHKIRQIHSDSDQV